MSTLAKRNNLKFRENDEMNAKYLLNKLQSYVEGLGGKVLKTERGIRVVSAINPEKDLVVNRKVFRIEDHISKIVPKPEVKTEDLRNKPGRTTVVDEVEIPSGRNATFSQRIQEIVNQFK
jgi:hypothetical protein